MSQGISFRAGTGMTVGAYVLIVGTLVAFAGHDLCEPVGRYAPQVSWLMPETTAVRMTALRAAGRPETAALYAFVVALSWGLMGAMAAGGFAWGVVNKGATVLGVDKALNYLTALAVLYALATTTEVLMHLLAMNPPEGGFQAMPALWFGAMIPSAAILARVGAMIAHDAGSLVAIALEAKPERLAALVANAEETRGSGSLEAKLARRMARLKT